MNFRLHNFTIGTAACAVLLQTTFGCGRHAGRDADTERRIYAIEDSMRAGQTAAAERDLTLLKTEAIARRDSDLWARLMVQQSVLGYYTDSPRHMMASADSAIGWIERQTPDTTRLSLLAKALQCKSAFFDRFQYDPDSSCLYLRKSIGMLERMASDRNLAVSLGNYANAMRMRGSLDSAAVYYHRAITLADSLRLMPDDYISLSNGLAGVFTDMRDFDSSKVWWERSMDLLPEMGPFDKFNTLTGYGNDLYYRKDYTGANKIFLRLASYLDSVPESRWERMFTDVNLADTYLRLGDADKASALLDSPEQFFSYGQPNPVCLSYIQTLRMREAWLRGDSQQTEMLIAANPADDTMRPEQLLARLEFLYHYYDESGQPAKALNAHFRYDHLLDSLRSDQLRQQLSALNATYRRDNRILNLEAANNKNKARIFRLWTLIAATAAILIVIIAGIIIARVRHERRERRMMDKIISLRTENLHNRVTPHFVYNALNHVLARQDAYRKEDISRLVRLIRHQQAVASEIMVPLAEELAFVDDYVAVMADNVKGPFDYSCIVDDGIDTGKVEFPSMSLQILVENAFKHAFPRLPEDTCKVLRIHIGKAQDGRIFAEVFNRSDGHSMTAAPGEGLGIRIVMETIRIINEQRKTDITFHTDPVFRKEGMRGYMATITLGKNRQDES